MTWAWVKASVVSSVGGKHVPAPLQVEVGLGALGSHESKAASSVNLIVGAQPRGQVGVNRNLGRVH